MNVSETGCKCKLYYKTVCKPTNSIIQTKWVNKFKGEQQHHRVAMLIEADCLVVKDTESGKKIN